MKLHIPDLLTRPWAISSSKYTTLLDIYDRHAAGEKFDVEGLRAAAKDEATADDDGDYFVQNGVAIVPIYGVLSKRMNLFSYFSGGTSTQVLTDTIQRAVADPQVHSLLLSIDSPGGEVDGTQVAAQAVKASTKPVLAWMDGSCCSGAYWIASQADGRYIADLTTWVGSIGVVAAHRDQSKANDQRGVKVTEITAGKYKRIASQHEPLSQDGRDDIQSKLDQIYSVFVDDVASGLGTSTDNVLSNMADGQTFIGQQAIDAGLAQGVASRDDLVAQLVASNQKRLQNPALPARSKAFTAELSGGATLPFQTPRASLPGGTTQTLTTGADDPMAYKSFNTEAEYQADIAAAEARGRAAATPTVDPNTAATQKAHKMAALMSERVREARAQGRTINEAKAHAELQAEGKFANL